MARKKKGEQPELAAGAADQKPTPGADQKADAKAAAVDTKKAVKEAAVAIAQAAIPLKVEIHFPSIVDLKQAIGFDADGNLIVTLQYKARVDQYEIFRLVNLLKQPHGTLFATIGSPQSAMDFKFTQGGKVEILKAELAQDKAKAALTTGKPAAEKPAQEAAPGPAAGIKPVTIQEVSFNHIPTEERPFGVVIDFVSNGTGELHTVAGRGKTATEAVIQGVMQTKGFDPALKQPFEIVAALKKTKETPAQIKIIRAIEVGSFDMNEGGKKSEDKGQ